jgi:hypothetical protein
VAAEQTAGALGVPLSCRYRLPPDGARPHRAGHVLSRPALLSFAAESGKCSKPWHPRAFFPSERSAARLAHQSGGLGVASSNLAAPTSTQRCRFISRNYLQLLANHPPVAYTSAYTDGCCGWSLCAGTPMATLPPESGSQTMCERNRDSVTDSASRRNSLPRANKGAAEAKRMFGEWDAEVAKRNAATLGRRGGRVRRTCKRTSEHR